jgi:hypothetical protein
MKSKMSIRSLVLFAALAIALPSFAKPVSQTFQLSHQTVVGKSHLEAGEYRFLIDGNKVTVTKGKNTMAESEGRWEERDSKANYTQIVTAEGGQVKELRFAGKKSVFILND